MARCQRELAWCAAVAFASVACSGQVEPPDGHDVSGGRAGSSSGAGAAGKLSAPGGSSSGAGGSAAGAGGLSGAAGVSGGGAGQSAAGQATGGAGSNEAEAQLVPTAGMASGTVHFTARGEQVEMVVTLLGCPAGLHALHLHANAACGDSANAAGGHWSPQGEGIGDISCADDGSAQLTFTSEPRVWSLGAPAASDVLQHALVLHAGPDDPDPGARIACGIAAKLP